MFDLEQTIRGLRLLFEMEAEEQKRIVKIRRSDRSEAFKDEMIGRFTGQIKEYRQLISRDLEELLRYPPQHGRHAALLPEFHGVAPYEKSVFVMTKFPDWKSTAKLDQELTAVIAAVIASVKKYGYHPRIAADKEYHSALWDNVELYMLGCGRGIAIVEDRYKSELNPNVAREWGWMQALGKKVLYLVEEKFSNGRADWDGLLKYPFSWDDPSPGIDDAIKHWLA